ncbi:DUF308 domain-containing protein [Mycobacterium sp. SMC-4]|uniref:DUF308 domain-containing protein n=1 Tax=Mycobacterium sp. SMC-4 TaxID=2857059 RepID=UPI003CFF3B62
MLIVALVLAVIGLAALVTAVVTSNEMIAWVCIAASAIGVILLIVDALRDRSKPDAAAAVDADDDADDYPEDYPDEAPIASDYEDEPSDVPDAPEVSDTTDTSDAHDTSEAHATSDTSDVPDASDDEARKS